MALKEYDYNNSTFQFEEGEQPEGATPIGVKAEKPAKNKARTPKNKMTKEPVADIEAASDPDASE